MHRVLRQGGHALVTAPFMFSQHGNPDDYYRFTPHGFEFLFKQAGFEVVQSGAIGNLWSVLACIWKARMKSKTCNFATRKFFYLLHKLFERLQPLFRGDAGSFFTNSYIIARKP